jgi:Ca2+-binding RTX toxin-like protein
MTYVSILSPITEDPLYRQVSEEISGYYTGATNYTAATIHDLAVAIATTGSEMSASDSSKSQIIGGALSWLGSGLETGTFGPLPTYSIETWTRAGFEVGAGALLAGATSEIIGAIAFGSLAYFTGGPVGTAILAAFLVSQLPAAIPYTALALAWMAASYIGLRILLSPEAAFLGDYVFDHGISPLWHYFKGDPIVLDLDGNGVELTSIEGSTTHFDFAGDGFAERTGWVSANDGLLAIDDNANGVIDNGSELFGSPTQDGFAVLEKLDTNGDGKIDAQDADFGKLRIWQDLNQNGVTDAGELKTLAEWGISSISLSRHAVGTSNAGNSVANEATFTRTDGSHGTAQSINFQTDRQDTVADNTPTFTPSPEVENIPLLPGSGMIYSIAHKASVDADFRDRWISLTDNASGLTPSELDQAFENLMLDWAGVSGVDPNGRGPYVDGRHLSFIEAYFGDTYREIQRDQELRTYPSSQALGAMVEDSYHRVLKILETAFLAQVAQSTLMRGVVDIETAIKSPYFFFSILDFSHPAPGDSAPETPGNVGMVVDFIAASMSTDSGTATDYLIKALTGLEGMIGEAFDGNRQAYADVVVSHLSSVSDSIIHDIAVHIAEGTAFIGTLSAEGINGTTGNDVFIGGGGGDVVSGGAGSDIYVYAKHDGNLWIRDDGPGTDTDRLVLTDLNAADVSLIRIGDNLLIKATATGNAVAVENFFNGNGIDVLRFADGSELDRTHIANASVWQGDGHNNLINDSSGDDVIHAAQGDDLIHIGSGNDTILYGKGDGYDVITDSSNSASERDTLILTDINSSDVELSRVGGDLILTMKSTGEYIDFAGFFPVGTGDWSTTARNIDTIRFADGEAWTRSTIQEKAWYRGTDQIDNIHASELNDTIHGGKGDDVLEGWTGSDTYIWSKGDGNDQISDFSSKIGDPNNADVTRWS